MKPNIRIHFLFCHSYWTVAPKRKSVHPSYIYLLLQTFNVLRPSLLCSTGHHPLPAFSRTMKTPSEAIPASFEGLQAPSEILPIPLSPSQPPWRPCLLPPMLSKLSLRLSQHPLIYYWGWNSRAEGKS